MGKDFGTVRFEGKEYTLTEDAYCDNYGSNGDVRYYAHAVDASGNECLVTWETAEKWNLAQELFKLEAKDEVSVEDKARFEELSTMTLVSIDDEANACDWDTPYSVEEI